MGMGFPMGLGIPWESHGNGNKTTEWEWEWEGMGMSVDGNGNDPYSHGKKFPLIFFITVVDLKLAYPLSSIYHCSLLRLVHTDIEIRHIMTPANQSEPRYNQ